jgi:hypothetical protein
MKGRRPSGAEYVQRLEGSEQAKERLHIVLLTLAGGCRVQEACVRLGICPQRFQQLRQQLLQAALDSLEPRPAGRPARPQPDPELEQLQQSVQQLQVQLQSAQVREEIALVLPGVVPADQPGKKVPRRRSRPSHRRQRQA